ncbi:MAG: hypothetical protein FWC42_02260 [Proteobacteria bacterium]|nr:hypothetical protein [Pseudomonadota bacterium]
MKDQEREILLQFIADESAALPLGEQGSFYPMNHHRITPLVPRAPRLLSAEERILFYFHLLRFETMSVKDEGEFQLLQQAHERLLPLYSKRVQIYESSKSMLHGLSGESRIRELFLFGRNDLGSVIPAAEATFDFYTRNLRFWRYVKSFTNIPGMLKKRSKFIEFADDVGLLAHTQSVLFRMQLRCDLFWAPALWFWAMAFLVLQNEEAGVALVKKILSGDLFITGPEGDSEVDEHTICEILVRYLSASQRPDLMAMVEARLRQA